MHYDRNRDGWRPTWRGRVWNVLTSPGAATLYWAAGITWSSWAHRPWLVVACVCFQISHLSTLWYRK